MNEFIPFQRAPNKIKGERRYIPILGVHEALWAHIKNWGSKTGAHIALPSEFLRARSLSLSGHLDHPLISA